jgi:hypothetical protein
MSASSRPTSGSSSRRDVLRSQAAGAADHRTTGSARPHTAVTVADGKRVMRPAEQVAGGDQYFLPQAWNFLLEVPASVTR